MKYAAMKCSGKHSGEGGVESSIGSVQTRFVTMYDIKWMMPASAQARKGTKEEGLDQTGA